MRRILLICLALVCLAASTGCLLAPPVYWAEAIHGRVVDAETGAPIEGVLVVADWRLYAGGVGHGGYRDSLVVEATLTDANGEFGFGKWGPKLRPTFESLHNAPTLHFLKKAYDYRRVWNENGSDGFMRSSDWDGKTIQLKKFNDTPRERIADLRTLLSVSQKPPLMLREILREEPLEGGVAFFQGIRKTLQETGQ